MRKKLRMLIRCGIMLVALIILMGYLTNLLERKDSVILYKPFFEQEADFDVLFMGSSHMVGDVFPMELWRDYGIVSYNLGISGGQMANFYWMLKNALDYTSPKLVVIDCLWLSANIKSSTEFSWVYKGLDAFPLSLNKIAAVFDLLDDPVMDELIKMGVQVETQTRTPLGLLWNFSIYHNRWNEGSKDWFAPEINRNKGAVFSRYVAVPDSAVEEADRMTKLEGDTVGIDYLTRMIDECQSRNIDVLLVYLPFPATTWQWQEANRAYDIAQEYGVNYINFLDMDVIDLSIDCSDANSHLNHSGGRKVTEYLGQYIMEHYDIADQRGNAQYSGWYDDYEAYKAHKLQRLQEQDWLISYLALLADRDYDALIEIDNPLLWKDPRYGSLAKNLGADVSQLREETGFIVVDGSEKTAQCIWSDPSQEGVYDTILGELRIECSEEGLRDVSLGGVWCVTASAGDGYDVRIRVLDMDKGERLDGAVFSCMMQKRM